MVKASTLRTLPGDPARTEPSKSSGPIFRITLSLPRGSIVVPFLWFILRIRKVIPQRNCYILWSLWVGRIRKVIPKRNYYILWSLWVGRIRKVIPKRNCYILWSLWVGRIRKVIPKGTTMEPMGRTTIEGRWVALGSDKQTLNDSGRQFGACK